MKILHVLSGPRAEGTPRLVLDWLDSDTEVVQELLFFKGGGELRAEFDAHSNWKFYNSAFPISFLNFWKIRTLVKQIVRERKPEMVISWNHGISPWVALGAWQGGCRRLLAHAGNFPGPRFGFSTVFHTNVSSWMHRFTGGKVVCCSRYVCAAYKKIPLVPASVYHWVYNCFRQQKFSAAVPWDQRQQEAIMVATLEGHKDHATLLEAWQILERNGHFVQLSIVGNGSLRQSLESRAEELGLKSVTFTGTRNDVPELLANTRLFVFSTTVEEGFGTVLLEALASGCRVLATDVPACREVLQDGKYGSLVEPASPVALADEVLKMFDASGAKTWNSSGADLPAYLSRFSARDMLKSYIGIFE